VTLVVDESGFSNELEAMFASAGEPALVSAPITAKVATVAVRKPVRSAERRLISAGYRISPPLCRGDSVAHSTYLKPVRDISVSVVIATDVRSCGRIERDDQFEENMWSLGTPGGEIETCPLHSQFADQPGRDDGNFGGLSTMDQQDQLPPRLRGLFGHVAGAQRLVWQMRAFRSIVLPLVDFLSIGVAIFAAQILETGDVGPAVSSVWISVSCVTFAVALAIGMYGGRWTVASYSEIRGLVLSFSVAGVAAFAVQRARGESDVESFMALVVMIACAGSAAVRGLWRAWYEYHQRPRNARRVMVVVDGETGIQLVRGMLLNRRSEFLPVAIIDDDPLHARRSLMGVPVRGKLDEVAAVAAKYAIDAVLVAAPHLPSDKLNVVVDQARGSRCEVFTVPVPGPADDPLSAPNEIRHLTEFDILQRRQISVDWMAITEYLRGRRVLVTGAGGSIGSELCRQISKADPACLIKLDRDESALQATQISIDGHGLLTDPTLVVADIRDIQRLHDVFAEFRPEIVFHAAALKHLTLLEMHPSEAVKTNVEGTQNVIDACAEAGVQCFVNVSTDKAADPTSVLGYSKRIGERLTAQHASSSDVGKYVSVRFGNVIGSRGSVIHSFRAQASKGLALTVTHPDVTRFFMTVEEAVLLVIQAGGIGRSGEALILDMGDPVRIDDLARRVAEAVQPSVGIVYTGLRPGEKLHEALFGTNEHDLRPEHPLVSHVEVPPLRHDQLARLQRGTEDDIRRALAELAWHDVVATLAADPGSAYNVDEYPGKGETSDRSGNHPQPVAVSSRD
jgi:FlaA1/EpsC-like NDP-sugar epimerase